MTMARVATAIFVVLVVGLALHNAAMAELYDLGVRGSALDVAAAWKEGLLLVGLLLVVFGTRELPGVRVADILAVAYTAIVLVYALLPQEWLDGDATTRGVFLALRHDLLPVAAYAFGRLLSSWWRDRERLGLLIAAVASGIAVIGILDLAFVPLDAWRDSGVPGWFRDQLGLQYEGLSGLPENWVYNTGDENNPIRRLVSTFLSPLASAYVLVVALVYLSSRPFRWWSIVLGTLCYAGLLLTHTRAALGALVVGLVVLGIAQRGWWPALLAALSIGVGAVFLGAYPSIGPSTSYTPEELVWLHQNAEREPGGSSDPFSPSESSASSHFQNLRDGLRVVARHPLGYGLGNSGVVAKRTGVEIKAGESTFTELGVDAGVAGLVAFVLWCVAIVLGLRSRSAWVAAAFTAVLFLGLQTDVIGVHWIAVVVFGAAGLALGDAGDENRAERVDEAEAIVLSATAQ